MNAMAMVLRWWWWLTITAFSVSVIIIVCLFAFHSVCLLNDFILVYFEIDWTIQKMNVKWNGERSKNKHSNSCRVFWYTSHVHPFEASLRSRNFNRKYFNHPGILLSCCFSNSSTTSLSVKPVHAFGSFVYTTRYTVHTPNRTIRIECLIYGCPFSFIR